MPSNVERRYTRPAQRVAVETREGGKRAIVGYAAVFYDASDPGTEYRLWDDVVERIMPGAFDRAAREDDVRGLFNHNDSLMLGRTTAGTMRLSVDRRGLRYEIDPPDTTSARDLLQLLDRGDVTGSSFAFLPNDTSYREVDGVYVIERNTVTLYDVGPVSFPAYTATEAAARSVTAEQAELLRREVQARRVQVPFGLNPSVAAALARAAAVCTLLAE
jgi:HK97 family phage prohead protease